MPKKNYYAVKEGRGAPVIVKTWSECESLVKGFPGALFKGFGTLDVARKYLGTETAVTSITLPVSPAPPAPAFTAPRARARIPMNSFEHAEVMAKLRRKLSACMQDREPLQIFTDGSCLDQGLSDRSLWRAGAGIYIPKWNWRIGLRVPGAQTNNRGELFAIIWILEIIAESASACPNLSLQLLPSIEIHTDANYVITNISSNNMVNLDLWGRLLVVLKKVSVIWKKELAHSGVEGNEIADCLAKRAADLGDFNIIES